MYLSSSFSFLVAFAHVAASTTFDDRERKTVQSDWSLAQKWFDEAGVVTFKQGLYENENFNKQHREHTLKLVTPQVGWVTDPTADQVLETCAFKVPDDLCRWREFKWRVFHIGDYKDEMYTGHFEIIFKNDSGDLWECSGNTYTKIADQSAGTIKYTDYDLDEGKEVNDFGYYWWQNGSSSNFPDHYAADVSYDYNGFDFQFRDAKSGSAVGSYAYWPLYGATHDPPQKGTGSYATGSYNTDKNVFTDGLSPDQRMLAINFFPMQIKKGQTVADEVAVTTPYQTKIPAKELLNPYQLKWMSTLYMEQDSAYCDTDIKKGAFKIDNKTWLNDAKNCENKCATFGFCATNDELARCQCDKIAASTFFTKGGDRCITTTGKAYSTTAAKNAANLDVDDASKCPGGCAHNLVCVGPGNESECQDFGPKELCDRKVKHTWIAAADGLQDRCISKKTTVTLAGGVAEDCPAKCANDDVCVELADIAQCAWDAQKVCELTKKEWRVIDTKGKCYDTAKEACQAEGKYYTAPFDDGENKKPETCLTHKEECAQIPNSTFRPVTAQTPRGWCLTFPVKFILAADATEADKTNAEKQNAKLCESGIRNWEDCVVGVAFVAPASKVDDTDVVGGSVIKADDDKNSYCSDDDIDDEKSLMVAVIIILAISVFAVCLCLVCCLYNPKCRQGQESKGTTLNQSDRDNVKLVTVAVE